MQLFLYVSFTNIRYHVIAVRQYRTVLKLPKKLLLLLLDVVQKKLPKITMAYIKRESPGKAVQRATISWFPDSSEGAGTSLTTPVLTTGPT